MGELASKAMQAARKALAEGEDIVRRARQEYRIGSRRESHIAPVWPAPPKPQPKPEPEPDPKYHLSERDREDIHAINLMRRHADVAATREQRAAYQRTIGQHLGYLRQAVGRDQRTWIEIVRRECALSSRTAYRLIETWKLWEKRASTKSNT
jgi:hypothetical protein